MLKLDAPSQPGPTLYLAVIDEVGSFATNPDDELKRELRDIPGIPNADFQVMAAGVFVFSKLVANVKAWRQGGKLGLPADIPSLVADATVSATEAVTTWSIVPRPFELVSDGSGQTSIRHSELGTMLPGRYVDQAAASAALAQLLVGGAIEGLGDFRVRGQAMTLDAPLSLDQLPPWPALELPGASGSTDVVDLTFQAGFPPVTLQFQRDLKAMEERWVSLQQAVRGTVEAGTAALWRRAERLEWPNQADAEPNEHAAAALAGLRNLYPELHALSDAVLCSQYDTYQLVCWDDYLWEARREDEFLLFLLAQAFDADEAGSTRGDGFSILEKGRWIGAALLQGIPPEQAVALSRDAQAYGRAFNKLLWRVRTAMGFLHRVPNGLVEPSKISTFLDLVAGARSNNPTFITATQDFSDFAEFAGTDQ